MFKVKVVSHLRQKKTQNPQTLQLIPTEAHASKKNPVRRSILKGNLKIVAKEMPNEGIETN